MVREAIATGETVEQAFENACVQLGVETVEAEFEVLELPEKKKLGLFGGKLAKVRAYIQSSPAQAAADYLQDLLQKMGLENVEISIHEEKDEEGTQNGALLTLSGDDIGFVIGHRGETLDALQYLAGLVANHVDEGYYRITLDIGNYREKRKETLEALGRKIALKAVKIGRNYPLEPMNPYERRIIHTAVQEVEGAKSWSEGEDIARHVVIGPVDGERPQRHGGYNNRGPRRSGGRGGYNNNRDRGGYRRDRSDRPRPTRTENEAPARPKVDSGSTALYGRIEVKK
ncbi:MAG: RNA-binding cell elongation regulator Jag/EloR [Candidatus Heritagella sp.]